MTARRRTLPRWLRLAAAAALIGVLLYQNMQTESPGPTTAPKPPVATQPPISPPVPEPAATELASRVQQLFSERRSGVVIEGHGKVEKLLRDDLEGSRHQRFILKVGGGYTLLVSHNIDLAPRIEKIRAGDRVDFRGQYEWNERGGVIHWTHRDPQGQRRGGWLKHQGRTYR